MIEMETMNVFAIVASSATVSAIISFSIKYAIKRNLDHYFTRQEAVLASVAELQKKLLDQEISEETAIYPLMSRIVYQCKIHSDALFGAQVVGDLLKYPLADSCNELTSRMLSWRRFLPSSLWGILHEYKRLVQDLVRIIDTMTRPDEVNLSDAIDATTKKKITRIARELASLCDTIHASIDKRMKDLIGSMGEAFDR